MRPKSGLPKRKALKTKKARVHFHYLLERRLTVRECARLQSFPDQFVFPHSASQNMLEIGNAVPPIIGHLIASQIYKFIQGYPEYFQQKF